MAIYLAEKRIERNTCNLTRTVYIQPTIAIEKKHSFDNRHAKSANTGKTVTREHSKRKTKRETETLQNVMALAGRGGGVGVELDARY